MTGEFKLVVCQNKVTSDKELNNKNVREMVREAASKGAQVVVLPEMFNCPYSTSIFPDYAESYPDGDTVNMLSQVAASEKIVLVGGSIPEKDGETIYNTSFTFGSEGQLLGRHRKLHLFDVNLPNLMVRESSTLGFGSGLEIIDAGFCKIGVIICFDVRFPELARLLALAGVQLLVIPAAFNTVTGPAHWDLTMRARAVDNQVYVVAASPARDEDAGYMVYGHSLVVNPWGEVSVQAGIGEEMIMSDISLDKIKEVRERLPLLAQMRNDLYELKLK